MSLFREIYENSLGKRDNPTRTAVLQNNFLIVSWLRENGNQTTFGETRYFVFLTCIDVQVHINVQKQTVATGPRQCLER